MVRVLWLVFFSALSLLTLCGQATSASGAAPASDSLLSEVSFETPVIDICDEAPVRTLVGKMSSYLDASGALTLEEIRAGASGVRFVPLYEHEPHFGFTNDAVWLRFSVRNCGERDIVRRIVLATNFMVQMDVWKAGAGGVENILSQSEQSPFHTRPVAYPMLVAPLELEASEAADIYVRFFSRGGTALPVRIETLSSFTAWAQGETIKVFVFYTIMFIFTLTSLIAYAALRMPIFMAYSAYALSVLMYLAQVDGVAFQYLWPNAPAWNQLASLPLGCALGAAAAVFARIFLDARNKYPLINWLLAVIIAGCVAILLFGLLVDERMAKRAATFWVMLGALCYFLIGVYALRRQSPQMYFFVIGWFGIVTATVSIAARDLAGLPFSRAETLDIVRLAMVFDATMMGLAVVSGIVLLRRERDRSFREEMRAVQKNLTLHERLNVVESRYAAAAREAELRGKALADTSHDIRQPLFAVRASLRAMENAKTVSPKHSTSIERSLSYIEALAAEHLKQEKNQNKDQTHDLKIRTPLPRVFAEIKSMFEADAAAKGVDLRVVPCSKTVAVDALLLLRILSNLITNAIQYSDQYSEKATVLVGCRRRGDRIRIAVYDNGPGVSAEDIERLTKRGTRGDAAMASCTGYGLGLSIVRETCHANGLEFSVEGAPGTGSSFSVNVPVAE